MLHVLRCLIDDESSSELGRGEPEWIARLTVQLELSMYPDAGKATHHKVMTHNNATCASK